MSTHTTGESERKTISLEPDLYERALARSKALGFRAFSPYVQRLISKDVEDGGDLIIRESTEAVPGGYPPHKPKPQTMHDANSALLAAAKDLSEKAEALGLDLVPKSQRSPGAHAPSA